MLTAFSSSCLEKIKGVRPGQSHLKTPLTAANYRFEGFYRPFGIARGKGVRTEWHCRNHYRVFTCIFFCSSALSTSRGLVMSL
jgi:hypothetical protein